MKNFVKIVKCCEIFHAARAFFLVGVKLPAAVPMIKSRQIVINKLRQITLNRVPKSLTQLKSASSANLICLDLVSMNSNTICEK